MRLCLQNPVLVFFVLAGAAACVAPTGPSADDVSSTEEAALAASELPPIPSATRVFRTSARSSDQSGTFNPIGPAASALMPKCGYECIVAPLDPR
jgi:hypothetical protein